MNWNRIFGEKKQWIVELDWIMNISTWATPILEHSQHLLLKRFDGKYQNGYTYFPNDSLLQ